MEVFWRAAIIYKREHQRGTSSSGARGVEMIRVAALGVVGGNKGNKRG